MNKEFFQVLQERYSCRNFKDKKIDDKTLNKLLSTVSLAPTACNLQPVKVMVINDVGLLKKLNETSRFCFNAKTVLIVMHDKNISWHRRRDNKDHGIIDSSIAATYLMQSCYALGLATTYVSSFNDELCHQLLDIPNNYEINCYLPIGYKEDNDIPSDFHFDKKEFSEIVSFNKL